MHSIPSFGFFDLEMPAIRTSRWEQLVLQPLKMNFEALNFNLDRCIYIYIYMKDVLTRIYRHNPSCFDDTLNKHGLPSSACTY